MTKRNKKILAQCRDAMLGGVPILYIKTDSDVLINNLVYTEEDPLVVLISAKDAGIEYLGRPIFEAKAAGKAVRAKNHSRDLPSVSGGLGYPHIWTVKMNETTSVKADSKYAGLEQFVLAHENPEHPSYEILQSSVVILYSSEVNLSPMLQMYTEIIEVPYPDTDEIREILKQETGGMRYLLENTAYLSKLCQDFLGFSEEEIVAIIRKILATTDIENDAQTVRIIRKHKRQKMEGGILELMEIDGEIGGMEAFRSWLERQKDPIENAVEYKRELGVLPPKGVLLCGIPGCGKSEAARFTAKLFDLPLLKMDIGSLMGGIVGESEENMRKALKLAESMAPCVLFIDELEKGFSDAGGGSDSNSGLFKRMFGYMLGWMQDLKSPCFIFATANNIGALPPEFFRSGRFEELFAVYLPTFKECVSIFRSSMERVTKASRGTVFAGDCFSEAIFERVIATKMIVNDRPRILIGADIQKIVNTALRSLKRERSSAKSPDSGAVTARKWESALMDAADRNICTVYGDSTENLESIAVSYCRLLRKGFRATGSEVLFRASDYHIENLEKLTEIERTRYRMRDEEQTEEERNEEYQREKAQYNILQGLGRRFSSRYDQAVYDLLYQKINELALEIERFEKQQTVKK